MHRSRMSWPAAELMKTGLLVGRILDYGCGHGRDADELGPVCRRWDPHWSPRMPRGRFDTVLVTYVLNVLPIEEEAGILERVRTKLRPGGLAFITVRRDVGKDGPTSTGTYQRNVELDLPVFLEVKKHFCTYVMEG